MKYQERIRRYMRIRILARVKTYVAVRKHSERRSENALKIRDFF